VLSPGFTVFGYGRPESKSRPWLTAGRASSAGLDGKRPGSFIARRPDQEPQTILVRGLTRCPNKAAARALRPITERRVAGAVSTPHFSFLLHLVLVGGVSFGSAELLARPIGRRRCRRPQAQNGRELEAGACARVLPSSPARGWPMPRYGGGRRRSPSIRLRNRRGPPGSRSAACRGVPQARQLCAERTRPWRSFPRRL